MKNIEYSEETWLAHNRSDIARKIEEGYAAAERGELLCPAEVRAKLDELKHSSSSKT